MSGAGDRAPWRAIGQSYNLINKINGLSIYSHGNDQATKQGFLLDFDRPGLSQSPFSRLTLNLAANTQKLVHTCVFTNGEGLATIGRSDCAAMTHMAAADLPAANPPPGPRPTRLFRNGNSQAVRIPSALAFENDKTQVEIERQGDELIIRPVKRKLRGLGRAFRELGPYFENFRREQPPMEGRDWEPRKP